MTSHSVSLFETATGRWWLPDAVDTDIVIQAMRAGEVFEPEVVDTVARYCGPGDVVLDVGSNFGQMAVLFSRLVGPEGRVHAFEADPFVLGLLRRNLEENGCGNVVVHEGAVWSEAGRPLLYPEPDFNRFGSFGSFGIDPGAKEGRPVESITIDGIGIEGRIRVIKIDIQGSDLFGLQGAVETIRRHQPMIIFEFETALQDQFGTNFEDYAQFIEAIGYRIEEVFNHNYVIVPQTTSAASQP